MPPDFFFPFFACVSKMLLGWFTIYHLPDKELQNNNVLAVRGQGKSMHYCAFTDQKQQFNNCYLVLNARPNSFH